MQILWAFRCNPSRRYSGFSRFAYRLHQRPRNCQRRFDRPNKQMRSICGTDKLCRSSGTGMSAANYPAVAKAGGL
ncbi:MAG: hypothetical protein LBK44_01430 [Spirochaetales bacterium]|nr:hypothetical protein [Spirochaetales bacterium]